MKLRNVKKKTLFNSTVTEVKENISFQYIDLNNKIRPSKVMT